MKKTIAILLIAIMALGAISTFDVVAAAAGHPGSYRNPCIVRIWVKPHWVWVNHHRVLVRGHWTFINICKPHPGPHPILNPQPLPPHQTGPHPKLNPQPLPPHKA